MPSKAGLGGGCREMLRQKPPHGNAAKVSNFTSKEFAAGSSKNATTIAGPNSTIRIINLLDTPPILMFAVRLAYWLLCVPSSSTSRNRNLERL